VFGVEEDAECVLRAGSPIARAGWLFKDWPDSPALK